MEYHVERVITKTEIQQRGEQVAIQDATDTAWCIAVRGAKPKRSLRLVLIETREAPHNGYTHMYTYRFHFEVDG